MTLRAFIGLLTPPAFGAMLRRLRPPRAEFQGVYGSFDEVPNEEPWNAAHWLDLSRRKLQVAASLNVRGRLHPNGVTEGHAIPCLVINQLTRERPCRVLDFAGGTGFGYYRIRSALQHRDRLSWLVVDQPALLEIGTQARDPDDPIAFQSELPTGTHFDVVYVNTSLQYIDDWEGLVDRLLAFEPSHLILTRLLAGHNPGFVTAQTIGGRRTPCRFIPLDRLLELAARRDYRPVLAAQGDPLDHSYADIPESLRVPAEVHLVLAPGGG